MPSKLDKKTQHIPAPPGGYLTLRLDVMNGLAKELAGRQHQRQLGLMLREVRLVLIIETSPGLTMGQLIARSFLEKTLVSKAITRLCSLGLVERRIGSQDARHVTLHLTRAGEATAEQAGSIARSYLDAWMTVLTQEEREAFDATIHKLTAKLLKDKAELQDSEGLPDEES